MNRYDASSPVVFTSASAVSSTPHIRFTLKRSVLVLLALVIGVATSLVSIPRAHAATTISFTALNGTVGTAQALKATVTESNNALLAGSISYYTTPGTLIGAAPISAAGVTEAVNWTPLSAGTVGVYAVYSSADASQTATSSSSTVTIGKVPTTTTLTAPQNVKLSTVVEFVATVKSSGTYIPKGSVSFLKGDGSLIETKVLNAAGTATSSIQMPATAQNFTIKATYVPDENAVASSSEVKTTVVSATGSNVTLTMAATGTPGVAIPIKADVTPTTSTGTMTLYLGTTVLDVKTLVNGSASFSWTPTATGSYVIKVNYSGSSTTLADSASQTVVVAALAQADRISLTPTTSTLAWVPNAGYVLRNGSSVTFNAKSNSGLMVSLASTGTCAVSGYTISAKAGTGVCVVNAATQGNANYLPATQTNTIALAAGYQTVAPKAPVSGSRLVRNRWYRLADPGLLTNVGRPVTWVKTYGGSRCTLSVNAAGAVVFKMRRAGTCKVAARAASLPGMWLALNKSYTYRG